MKSSIRKFLLINLLLAITVTTSLTAIGNYYLDQKDIQEHLDTLMAVSALSYQALLGDDVHERPIPKLQAALEKVPHQIRSYYEDLYVSKQGIKQFLDKFNFQVWTDGGKLLLHSASAPRLPLFEAEDGFSDKVIDGQKWRIFTAYNAKAGTRTVLAEKYGTRNELGHRIALDDLYIMLLTFPLSGLLIWIIIGRGLDSLDKVAEEVSSRAPTHLEPVNIKQIPEEIKPVIDELNKLFFRLKQGFEREKRFAADAAHELRTPLAALKAQAQVALHTQSLEEKDQALHKLIASVDRSTHIVQQLLTMHKMVPEAVRHGEQESVNLIKLTREIIAMLAPAAVEKQIDLSLDTEKNIPILQGNQAALSILIRNLVDNAIRYSKNKGKVNVYIKKLENDVIIEIEDTGPGIPEELRQRVFERFFRILGNKSTGSGLGLAIVQQVVDLHGGRIELDTPVHGNGLIVRVYLPV